MTRPPVGATLRAPELRELLDLATSPQGTDQVLERVARLIERSNPGARSSIMLISEDSTHLVLVAAPSLPPSFRDAVRRVDVGEGNCTCGTAAFRAEAVVSEDLSTDPAAVAVRAAAAAAGFASAWSQPILSGTGTVLGTIANFRATRGVPPAEELDLVANAAQCAALVIERSVAEKRRIAQERNLSAILTHALEAILRLDAKGRFLFANPAAERLAGRGAHELTGKSPRDLGLAPAICEMTERLLSDAAISAAPRRGEFLLGETWLNAVAVPEVDDQGALTSVVVVARDITEQRSLEERIRQAEKMESLGRLAGGIAHDFNNILAAILGYSELVLHDVPPRSEAADNVEQVLRASRRARDLVRQILAFSRKSEVMAAPLDVRFAVRDALRLLRASIPATVELHEHIADTPLIVSSEASQVSQIVLNLGTNAEFAMRRRGYGRLDITLDAVNVGGVVGRALGVQPGRYVRLVMEDNGEGIADDVLPKIFDPFFTTKRVGEGTGMGLAVVHGIVATHGGAHRVDSAPGRGTRFEILLPRLSTPTVTEVARDQKRATGSGRVLVVDDEDAITSMLQRALPRRGFEVQCLTSAHDALAVFRRDPGHFDVVVTDRTMPQMTGEALIQELRSLRPTLPIVLSSGRGHPSAEESVPASVVQLAKPFDANELIDAIRRAVEGSK